MSAHLQIRLALLTAAALLLSACGHQRKSAEYQQSCTNEVAGETMFIGSPACMKRLPPQHLTGLWVLGLENSRFYENTDVLPAQSSKDVWLEGDAPQILKEHGLRFDGSTHAYRIDFIGTKSDVPGTYGHNGVFKRGAMILRVISLKKLS